MHLKPVNRHLLVEPITEEEQEETGVLVPKEYNVQNPFTSCRVVSIAPDCSRNALRGDIVVVRTSMLEEVSVRGTLFYLVLDNHVIGVVDDS